MNTTNNEIVNLDNLDIEYINKQFKNGGIFSCRFWMKFDDVKINSIIEDIVQIAWIKFLERQKNQNESVTIPDYFYLGKLAAQHYFKHHSTYVKNTICLTDLMTEITEYEYKPTTSRNPLPTEISEQLLVYFYNQRKPSSLKKKKNDTDNSDSTVNQRYLNAAMRDTLIIDLLHQGYSDHGIALELNITYFSVRTFRRQIKKRLQYIKQCIETNQPISTFQPK